MSRSNEGTSPKTTSANDPDLAASLFRHVDTLAGVIGPRDLSHLESFRAAARYIERELYEIGYEVDRQVYLASGTEVENLIVELPGIDRESEIVVIGAHYDTIADTPGADDNASGVAMLIELARLSRELKFRRTVRLVAFACEEPPYFHSGEMGSQVYARYCRQLNENVVGMLCLEMVGYYSSKENSQEIPPSIPKFMRRGLPARGDFFAAVGNLQSARLLWTFRRGFKREVRFPLVALPLPESVSEIRLSDNSSFWDQGYRALMLTDTSFLRNPHYHQASDTPETLDYARMAEVTIGVLGGVKMLAGIRQ